MPSLRIPFPEKDTPSVIALRGKRITVGRLPQNTIQILDRTISAYHAELVQEGDHYRVHDVGSTNAVLVNGELVTDFHLSEACKVTFGGVECEFSPETPAEAEVDPAHALMSHADREALNTKVSELEQTVATLRSQLEAAQNTSGGEGTVNRDLILAEVTALTEAVANRDREIEKLKADYAVLYRDRAVLQRALNEAKAVKAEAPAAPAPTAEPVAPVKAEALAPKLVAAPSPAAAPVQEAPDAPAPVATPAAPKPSPWVAKPAAAPGGPLPKPSAPLPHAASAEPAAVPAPAPKSRPAFVPPGAAPKPAGMPAAPTAIPAAPKIPGRLQPAANGNGTGTAIARPTPVAKSPAGAPAPQAAKPSLATRMPAATSGPKGTQKIG